MTQVEHSVDTLLDLAMEAAELAGRLLRDGRPAGLGVAATKSSPVDVVTEMDIAAEKLITEYLVDRRPLDGYLGEEGGTTAEGSSGVRWVIDPLDGTVNYLYGLPSWAVSIGVEVYGERVAGVVEVPMRGETYYARRGHGAFVTGGPYGDEQVRLRCRPPPRSPRRWWPPASTTSPTSGRTRPRWRARWFPGCGTSGGEAPPRSTSATWPPAGSTATTSAACTPGTAAGDIIAREAGALTGGRPGRPADGELTVAASPGVFEPLQALLEELGAWHD